MLFLKFGEGKQYCSFVFELRGSPITLNCTIVWYGWVLRGGEDRIPRMAARDDGVPGVRYLLADTKKSGIFRIWDLTVHTAVGSRLLAPERPLDIS